jgi:predicted dehydrogenase
MQSRRKFIGKVATGLAGTLATSNVLGANDRVRFGVIGAGARGAELLREAVACQGTECLGVADIYQKRLEETKAIATGARTWRDYRSLLEDPAIDAVLIATPPHLHATQLVAAIEAGKHVYVERPMAFTIEDARRMRAAWQASRGLKVQVGHQACTSGQIDTVEPPSLPRHDAR